MIQDPGDNFWDKSSQNLLFNISVIDLIGNVENIAPRRSKTKKMIFIMLHLGWETVWMVFILFASSFDIQNCKMIKMNKHSFLILWHLNWVKPQKTVRMICWQFTVFIHLYRKQNPSLLLTFCPESSHGMEMSSKKYSIFWCLHWTDTLLKIVIFLIFRWTLLSSKGSYTIIIWSIAIKFLPLEGTASNLSFYAICERVTTFYRWASYVIWDFQAMSNARVTQTRFMTS